MYYKSAFGINGLGCGWEVMKNYSVRLCKAEHDYVMNIMPGKSFGFCLRTLIAEHAAAYGDVKKNNPE